MCRFKSLLKKIPLDQWVYFESPFWHLRWRGGRFVKIREMSKGTREENGEHYLKCLDELSEIDGGSGYMNWNLKHFVVWGYRYEMTTVSFRTKDDALMFKLAWA